MDSIDQYILDAIIFYVIQYAENRRHSVCRYNLQMSNKSGIIVPYFSVFDYITAEVVNVI